MKILVTGAKGFTASHLLSVLKENTSNEIFLSDIHTDCQERYYSCDLSDPDIVFRMLYQIRPDQIYHLAGVYSNQYDEDYRVNVVSTKNLCDSMVSLGGAGRLLLVGSAAEYGTVSTEDNPVRENKSLRPVSVYGLSKSFQTHIMNYYVTVYGLDIVMARTFNILGKGLSNRLFIGRLYQQIEDYREGKIEKIKLGNLLHKRDYLPIAKVVEYYMAIMAAGDSGVVYNVGSGKSIRIQDLLELILKEHQLPMSIVESDTMYIPGKLDIEDIYADTGKLDALLSSNRI